MSMTKDTLRKELALDDVRKTALDTGFAVVGATDMAVERARDLIDQRVRQVQELPTAARTTVRTLPAQAKALPGAAIEASLKKVGEAERGFADLAIRGRDLVGRIKTQPATKDLLDQAGVAFAKVKGASTSAATTVEETAAAATEVAETVATTTAKSTTAAAAKTKRTATKRAQATTRATKAAATSTRKTAAKTPKAASKAAATVGK